MASAPRGIIGGLQALLGQRAARDLSDRQLLESFASGQQENALAVLVQRYGPLVWAVCGRVLSDPHDREDAFQATFLVLVRKAGALDRQRPLGNWLYTVAYRVALKARDRTVRRRRHEALARDLSSSPPGDAVIENELGQIVDAELNRLPYRYRAPLVLCYLQGKTQEKTAEELGWPLGSVKGRLSRARELLRGRLERRGLGLSAAALTTFLGENGMAAVPAPVVESTLATALHFAAGEAAALSLPAASLADGILRAMIVTKIKIAAAIACTLAALGAGALAIHTQLASGPDAVADEVKAPASASFLTAAQAPLPGPAKPEPVDRPLIQQSWQIPLLPTGSEVRQVTQEFLKKDGATADDPSKRLLPGFHPQPVGQALLFRTFDGVFSIDLKKDGKINWYSYTDGGLTSLFADPNKKGQVNQWRVLHADKGPYGLLSENSLIGCLSSDGHRAFAVDDLVIPPPPSLLDRQFPNFGSLHDSIQRNSLKAYHIGTGKLIWAFGGQFDKTSDLASSFFLGPPLPVDGKLYVLTEKNCELQLLCLQCRDSIDQRPPLVPAILWTQKLGTVPIAFNQDLPRRVRAVPLLHHDDLLICPTHAGAVVAVDRTSAKVLWKFEYRDPAEQRIGWKMTSPVIQDGKLIYTPIDSNEIFCLEPRTGNVIWKASRGDNLYLAGVWQGIVMLVGPQSCRGLSLATGKLLWQQPTGVPAGQGFALRNLYYLPVRSGIKSQKPEICVLDMANGTLLTRFRISDQDALGNLIFAPPGALSQTWTRLTAFPKMVVNLEESQRRLTTKELDLLWSDLADGDFRCSESAAWLLASTPKQTVAMLRERVRPVVPADPVKLARWIEQLDDQRSAVRQKAEEDLENLGELAIAALKRTLATKPPLEVRQRIERILDKHALRPLTSELQRALRAVEVLEEIGTEEAQTVLKTYVDGAPEASLTNHAGAVLQRLASRKANSSP